MGDVAGYAVTVRRSRDWAPAGVANAQKAKRTSSTAPPGNVVDTGAYSTLDVKTEAQREATRGLSDEMMMVARTTIVTELRLP
jgi:hypothetical protein